MDSNKRFDQIESLLVDLARKVDRQGEQIAQIITELNRQGEAINRQGEAINQQSEAINRQGEAINQQGEAINRQGEAINQQGAAINQQGAAINQQGEGINRLEDIMVQRFGDVGEQIGDIITILKLSEARHTENAQQQAEMLTEVQRLGKRTDASVEAIKLLLKRQEATDTRLDGMVQTQLQMLQLQRLDADKIDELNRKLPAVENQEPRIKRLEDEVFRAAS